MASKFTEDNRKFFDDLADKYDVEKWQQDLIALITTSLRENLAFINLGDWTSNPKAMTTLLDYACGTGVLSRALGPYVFAITGVDISENMLSRYKDLASSSEIPAVKNAVVRQGNLVAPEPPKPDLCGLDLQNFSVAAISAGFHHFEYQQLAIERLAERLGPGGALLIIDFLENDEEWQRSAADHVIHKHGFSEKEMKGMMEGAGLVDFGWKVVPEKAKMELSKGEGTYRSLFLARAFKKRP